MMMHVDVVSIVRGQKPELFGSINTAMMEFFDDQYVARFKATAATATATVATAGIGVGRAFQYRDFDNT